MDAFIEFAKETPAWAFAGYLLWRMTQQESQVLAAFREGAASHRQLAEAIQTLQRVEETDQKILTAISELRIEMLRSVKQ